MKKSVAIIGNQKKVIKTQGAGPVGLTLSLLLKKFNIPITLIEKNLTIASHPAAHYVNLRSMEIFSELYGIDKKIHQASEPIDNFRYFRYQRRLFDPSGYIGKTDQFAPIQNIDVEEKREEIKNYSYSFPTHIPQHKLAKVLYEQLKEVLESKDRVLTNREFVRFEKGAKTGKIFYCKDRTTEKQEEFSADYLVACDGFRSPVRSTVGIGLIGDKKLQTFLNVYFESKKLSNLLLEKGENAMLHFLYNSQTIAVLVNHSYLKGEFVLQVPIFPDSQPLESFTPENCITLINNCIHKDYHLSTSDIIIKNTGFWTLSGVIAEKYFEDNVILCGDAAHSFPPAGGFGMNTGIQDAYNLAFKLSYLLKHDPQGNDRDNILKQYWVERKSHAQFNLGTAMKYYQTSLNIASELGLRKENLDLFRGALNIFDPLLPKDVKSKVFEFGKSVGSMHIEKSISEESKSKIGTHPDYKIPLIFLKEETQWKYNYPETTNEKNRGILCPHIFIRDFSGDILSTRGLNEYLLEKSKEYHYEDSEIFYIVITFKSTDDHIDKQKLKEIVSKEPVKGRKIYIKLLPESRRTEFRDSISKDNLFFTEDLQKFQSKLDCSYESVILMRSDATILKVMQIIRPLKFEFLQSQSNLLSQINKISIYTSPHVAATQQKGHQVSRFVGLECRGVQHPPRSTGSSGIHPRIDQKRSFKCQKDYRTS